MTDLFEQVFCCRIIWVCVWVQLTGALAVRALNLISTCGAIYF
jgi:hypothetical protein